MEINCTKLIFCAAPCRLISDYTLWCALYTLKFTHLFSFNFHQIKPSARDTSKFLIKLNTLFVSRSRGFRLSGSAKRTTTDLRAWWREKLPIWPRRKTFRRDLRIDNGRIFFKICAPRFGVDLVVGRSMFVSDRRGGIYSGLDTKAGWLSDSSVVSYPAAARQRHRRSCWS